MRTRTVLITALSAAASLAFLLLGMVASSTKAQASLQSSSPCIQCHAEAFSQPATRMAHALETAEQSDILANDPLLTATYGKYSYRIERKGNQSLYSVTDGTTTVTMPIRWALGASFALVQTYILEKDGELYESRMSWFQELNSLVPTLGNAGYVPSDVKDAAGRLLSHDEKQLCFGCHATDAVHGTKLTLGEMRPGVQCERCHQAADAHLVAMLHGKGDRTALIEPPNLDKFSTEEVSNFCGQCHRTWAEIAKQTNPGIANIRFQPYRLTGSKCYDPDDKRISCIACHNPHEEVDYSPEDYDGKCLACHKPGGKPGAKACTVAQNKCATCHMPKIDLPGAHYKFSDHRIRIVKPNEPYPG